MKHQKYYKVLRRVNRQLWSMTANAESNARSDVVRYQLNKWTFPRKDANQFLFIVNNIDAARRLAGANFFKSYVIYEIEVRSPATEAICMGEAVLFSHQSPDGTRFAKAVKLIRKVA